MGIVSIGKFFMSYWKPIMISLMIVGAYFYGHSTGIEDQKVVQERAVQKAKEQDAKDLAKLQQQLLDTEAQLLDTSDKIKIEYRDKVKKVTKYVEVTKNNGVDLSKCELDDHGMQLIRDAYK